MKKSIPQYHNYSKWETQPIVVINHLIHEQNMSVQDAARAWYKSNTKRFLEENNMYWVSGMRCYWELLLEINNDPRWLRNSFET